jgi:hypothetical protein
MSLLPSCFAPSKRKRRANNTNDVLPKLDLFLSEVSMRDAPVQKRPRKSSQHAPLAKEVVSLFFITGTRKEESGIEEEYVIAKLCVRPPPRGSYVKVVPTEKKLAVYLVHAFQSSGDSLNASIEQVKAKCSLFSTLCVSTYYRFRKQLDGPGAEGNNDAPVNGPATTQQPSAKRAGRPSIVTAEHR